MTNHDKLKPCLVERFLIQPGDPLLVNGAPEEPEEPEEPAPVDEDEE